MDDPKIKQTYLAHRKETNLEKLKPDNEKSELTVEYEGSYFVENSPKLLKISDRLIVKT